MMNYDGCDFNDHHHQGGRRGLIIRRMRKFFFQPSRKSGDNHLRFQFQFPDHHHHEQDHHDVVQGGLPVQPGHVWPTKPRSWKLLQCLCSSQWGNIVIIVFKSLIMIDHPELSSIDQDDLFPSGWALGQGTDQSRNPFLTGAPCRYFEQEWNMFWDLD